MTFEIDQDIQFDGIKATILHKFPVLHRGWEMDETGYVVKLKSTERKAIVLTNHGMPHLASNLEIETKLKDYRAAIQDTLNAVKLTSEM